MTRSGPLTTRIPEPELMDDAAQAAAYAGADFAEVNAGFVARFTEQSPEFAGSILDLGCGPGDIAIRLCRALPGCTVTAVDGAPAMLEHARTAVRRGGLESRVELVCARVPGSVASGRRFDAVVSNSLLHHLPDPDVLWREIASTASAGAHVLVMDLRRPATAEAARDIVDTNAAGEPEVLRVDFFNSLCAAFTVDEVSAQLQRRGLAQRLRVQALGERHLLVWGRL